MAAYEGRRLAGKIAVVTGSTDGIGFAAVKRLAEEGAKVVVSSRSEENVSRAVDSLKESGLSEVIGVVCDVSMPADRQNLVREAVTKFGGIDIVVMNAATNLFGETITNCSEKVWDTTFDVNVKSYFMLTKEVLPHLRKRGGGSIVYVSSMAAYLPYPILGVYNVSKTALLGLTKAVAQDVVGDNIRVNCLAPGAVKTEFSRIIYETESALSLTMSLIPMKRMAAPDEMAGTVAFLCSDDASYITGETFAVAGGINGRL